ncbi:hypothetical protein GCM10023347_38580 [Streptomyces chumphonensis]
MLCANEGDAGDETQPAPEDDLSRRCDELSKAIRKHFEELGR